MGTWGISVNVAMYWVHSSLFILPLFSLSSSFSPSSRNLPQLYTLVTMQTNCSLLEMVTMARYKNWCGLGDNGLTPADKLDACCEEHDNCYGDIQDTGLCLPHPIMEEYQWTVMENQTVTCGVCEGLDNEHGDNDEEEDESLLGKISQFLSGREQPSCTCATCLCDLQLALCLKRVGHCAPPLFGVPGFIEEQINVLHNITTDIFMKAGDAVKSFGEDLMD